MNVLREERKWVCGQCARIWTGKCLTCKALRQGKRVAEDPDKELEWKNRVRRNLRRLSVLDDLPRGELLDKWGQCAELALHKKATARTTDEKWEAELILATLKAVLVKPKSTGTAKHAFNFRQTRRLMDAWLAGDFELVWRSAVALEEERDAKRRPPTGPPDPVKELEGRKKAAEKLVHLNRRGKAMGMLGSVVARKTPDFITQILKKHPRRANTDPIPRPTRE